MCDVLVGRDDCRNCGHYFVGWCKVLKKEPIEWRDAEDCEHYKLPPQKRRLFTNPLTLWEIGEIRDMETGRRKTRRAK